MIKCLKLLMICLVSIYSAGCDFFVDNDEVEEDVVMISGLKFDGAGDYAVIGNSEDFNLSKYEGVTIEGWVKSEKWGNWNWIISHGTSNYDNSVLFGFDKGRLRFITSNLDNDLLSDRELNLNEWYHVSAVLNKENKEMSIYVNGVLDSKLALKGQLRNTRADLFIGAREFYGSRNGVEEFWGVIHELRMWSYPKDPSEIRKLMNVRLIDCKIDLCLSERERAKLLAYWPLSEEVVDVVNDKSGNNHQGLLYGDAQYVRFTKPWD